jgi:demethylmenaquinone methyltransferase / 2-methoxy-6-polyprenyl-1,4-benzoquinol methylase
MLVSGIQKLYTQVPPTYELINHLLTFGLDIAWRKKAVKYALKNNGSSWLDVCSGTGETACYLVNKGNNNTRIFATDFSLPMLSVAKSKPEGRHIGFSISEIKNLPFPDNMFDLVIISFATRNINTTRDDLVKAFREIRRVLKSEGIFINLETSQPDNSFIKFLFHQYVKAFIKPIGGSISGSKAAYAYLAATMQKFYGAEELKQILTEAGFNRITFDRLLFGAAAIHTALK